MPVREGSIIAARSRGIRLTRMVGMELRHARRMTGISQRRVGAAVGLSAAEVGRIERNEAPWLTIIHAAELLRVVGLDLAIQVYPAGQALRDAAHLRLLERFESRIAPAIHRRREWPLPLDRDRRAIDLVLEIGDVRIGVEAETVLTDLQALERRLNLKQRDARLPSMILVVSASQRNREILRTADALRRSFPGHQRGTMDGLVRGELPEANAIVLL